MSTHSLRKKLLRSRPQATQGQRTLSKLRKYAPWVAAICVGAYLPPKVMSSVWRFDADGAWNNNANWNTGTGPVPNNNGEMADFTLNFTADRTISLLGPPISPTVSSIRFNDTSPSSMLTISGDNSTQINLKAGVGGQALVDVSKGNTLRVLNTAGAANLVLSQNGVSGLNKTGLGLFSVNGTANYTGGTTLSQGILVASIMANGGSNSSIGASDKGASRLVFDGGVLRYVSPGSTAQVTDRSFTIAAGGATIDSSSANAAATLIFGTTGSAQGSTIVSDADGDRRLTLRGTNTGTNEIAATITDFGSGHTSVEKLDTGLWRLSASLLPTGVRSDEVGLAYSGTWNPSFPDTWTGAEAYGNTYTGPTTVQRGTLQILFPNLPTAKPGNPSFTYTQDKHLGVISPDSTLQLGSAAGSGLPGGGRLELAGGAVQRTTPADSQNPGKFLVSYQGAIQDFKNVVVNSGANSINRISFTGSLNNEYVYFPTPENIVHNLGGTLTITADNLLKVGHTLPLYVNGIFNGWLHRDDNWAWTVPVETIATLSTLSPRYETPYALNATPPATSVGYTIASDAANGYSGLTVDSNALQNGQLTGIFANGGISQEGNQRYVNSMKFDGTLPATQGNKEFRVGDGDNPADLDFLDPPTTLAIVTGGLLSASSNAITQLVGGRITSGSGDYSVDTTDPNNFIYVNRGGGTLGQSELFAIIRSSPANAFYLSSGIIDYQSRFGPKTLNVGLTKSGQGTLILTDATSTGLKGAATSNFQGDVYINEGILAIRADHALGLTIDRTDSYTNPVTGEEVLPNDGADGTHGQTYLLGNTAVLDFQAVRYTLPEKVNVNQGEIRASIGRSSFPGLINNLNEEEKVILNIGTYLQLDGHPDNDGQALIGVGGYRKLGAGVLVVNGAVKIGTHVEDGVDVPNTSEFPGSGDLTLEAGFSSWNGPISVTNGSILVSAGQHAFNGAITVVNGHLTNANSIVGFTRPGQLFTVELQQSGANAQTLFGSLKQTPDDGVQVYTGPITVGAVVGGVSQPGGSLAINGSIDFGTSTVSNPIDLTRGSLSQVGVVNAAYIPTTRFYGPVTFGLAGTITLNHNTLFNETLTLGQISPVSVVNLVTNGIGHTTFNGAVTVLNGSLTLTDTSFTLPYTQAVNTLTLNGLNTFNNNGSGSALTITGGSGGVVVETGTRRTAGVYGVRDFFNGDLTIAPPAALNTTLAVTFSGSNAIQGNINVNGAALLPGITLQRSDVTFANAQSLSGNLLLNGGQVTISNSNALGAGNATPGTGLSGVTLQGEKTVLLFQRGVATATNEDIVIAFNSTAFLSGVGVGVGGAGYTSTPTLSISGGLSGGGINAAGTAAVSGSPGNQVLSVTLSNVGTGYNALPTITATGGGSTSAATLVPVFASAIIRGADQHNVLNGAIILNNASAQGKLNLGVPMLSVGADDTLQINGDIYGVPTISQANTSLFAGSFSASNGQLTGRFLTTAMLGGGGLNSQGGIIILSGQVKDTSTGAATPATTPLTATSFSNVLNTEWVGSNDLNVQVEKQWNSNGLIQLAQGVMRYTNTAADQLQFFANNAPNFALSVPNTPFARTSIGFNSIAGNGIQSAAFFLTQPGQVFNAKTFTAYLGNSNKVVLDGASTGIVSIGGENTSGVVTYGTHTGTIVLDTDSSSTSALRDLRLYANAGGAVDIQHAIVKAVGQNGQISIDKVGDGTVYLSGSGTSTTPQAGTSSALDRVFVLGGTLELRNFGQYTTSQRLGSNAQMFLGGGTLRLFTGAATGSAAATANVSQTVAGSITIRNGLSSVQVQGGPGSFTSTLQIGSGSALLTRVAGGAVRFATTGGANEHILFNASSGVSKGATNPIFWASYGTSLDQTSANAATHFGFIDSASTFFITPYTSATANDDLNSFAVATPNIEEAAAGTGFFNALKAGYGTVNTIRFHDNATGAGHGTLNLNNQTISLGSGSNAGGIMVSSNATGNTRVISNGTLIPLGGTAALPNDLMIQNWGGDGTSAPKLQISAILANNGTFDSPVSIVGDGTTVLTPSTGSNTFRGSIYLSGGTLEVGAVNSTTKLLGDDSATAGVFKNLFMDGATLHNTGDFTWDKRNIVVYGDRSTIQIDSGKTFALLGSGTAAGGINSQGPEMIGSGNYYYGSSVNTSTPASGSANIFSGDLVIAGQGTFLQVRDNVANTIAGQMFVQGSARFAYEGNNFNGLFGNNLSWMDGTTVAGGTIELRPTINSSGSNTIGEWLHISGVGQPGAGGALVMKRPEAIINGVAVNAAAAVTDHTLSWTGPVTMDASTTVYVDDKPEIGLAGVVGQLTFDDTIFDGGTTGTLTKSGQGILRFNNSRIQNLGSIQVNEGEVRFEGGILGTIGSEANKVANGLLHTGASFAPSASFNNFTSGTNSIVVGTGATSLFATGARLAFVDVRGTHGADITLNNGFLFVQSADAPLQATSFAGDFNLVGSADSNAIEAVYTNRVNPIVFFGAINGTGGFTKFGNNELDFVNPNSTFSGEIQVSRGGGSLTSPAVGLYDGGRFLNVGSIRLTNDGSFFLDNQNSLNASTADDNQNDRINDNAALHLGGAGQFRLLGNSLVATTEALGVLNSHLGSTGITLAPAVSGQNVGLSFDNYTRDFGGVVSFRVLRSGTNFGNGTDEFGDPLSTGSATITIRGNLAPNVFKGGAGLDRLGGADPQSSSIVVGAFGGVVQREYSTLPTNTSLPLALINNDQAFAGRGMMTVETAGDGTKYLRPLKDSEYLNAGPARVDALGQPLLDPLGNPLPARGIRVTDTYDFDALYTKGAEDPNNPGSFPDPANGTHKNVRLIGGFGPSTSAVAETAFATQGFYTFDQRDDSRKQDSLYRVLADVEFNSLTFAQQTTEIVDGGGNRIILEISPDKTLTIGSGMILHAGLGIIGGGAPNAAFNSTQSALIRGGSLQFGANEAIIQNVAAGLNETTGVFSSFRQVASSPVANLNIGASDLTISSSIYGTGGLTKSGPSTVNLSGVNHYSGDTNVVEGILRIENEQALGNSHLVNVSGTGELRMQRGITLGDPGNPHALKVKFASMAQPAAFRAEAGNNLFYGDILINTLNEAGDRVNTAASAVDVSLVNGTGASFTLGGDIYGVDTAGGGITPLNDVQRGRQSRIVNFNNANANAGVIQIRGVFHDLESGAVTSVQSDNEEQVLRASFTGFATSNVQLYTSWDAAGSILLRQGALHLMPGVNDFFTVAASNAINPNYTQAHPIISDVSGFAGDVLLSLTTAGQVFNSPTLQILNNTNNNITLAGENTTGTVKFFAPSATASASSQFNNANLRTSFWDRNVRLYAPDGGTVEIDGRITDTSTTNNGSITKMGLGTVIMAGMDGATAGYVNGTSNVNDFDKGITVSAGRLILDSNVNSNTAVANIWGATGTPLTLAGGAVEIRGDADVRATNNWTGVINFKSGASELALVPNAGGVTVVLGSSANATTRAAGATVNFVTPSLTGGIISYLSTTGVGATGSALGAWATFGAQPGQATDFAATGAGDASRTLIALTGYTVSNDPSTFTADKFAREAATGFLNNPAKTLASAVKLIRFDAPAIPTTLYITPGGVTLGTSASQTDVGAILVPSGTTALKTISGGDLQVIGNKELFIHNYGSGGLNLQTPITGATPVVLAGPGTTTLGANRTTGAFFLNGGVTSIDKLNIEARSFSFVETQSATSTFTLPDVIGIRTGSAVVTSTGVSLGTVQNINGNTIIVTGSAPAGTIGITINPSSAVTTTLSLPATSSNQVVVQTTTANTTATAPATPPAPALSTQPNLANITLGATVLGAGVPDGTTVTGIDVITNVSTVTNGTTNTSTYTYSYRLTFSNSLSLPSTTTVTLGLANGLGLGTSASTSLSMNGGTLQYTGNSVLTDRSLVVDNTGATFDITNPSTSLMINTLVAGANAFGPSTVNSYGGGVTKIGPGTLVVSSASAANTYNGPTDIREGTLTFQGATTSGAVSGPFGSSTNALDGTTVRGGATLRMNAAADLTSLEWLTFENGATLDMSPQNANRTFTADGVINLKGDTTVSYTGTNAGSGTVTLNTNAGYLTGAGTLTKGTVNNGIGGQLILAESNPEFKGGINIEGGRVVLKSVGSPTGTGTLPINLGTAAVNDLTSTTSKGSTDARLIFAMRDISNQDGGTTLNGAFDSFQINVAIPQDIIVQRPADAPETGPSTQIKQIGVIGTGLSLDQYNLNGNLRLKDDLQFYVEDNFARVNSGEEYVNFNINGHIITETPIDPNTGLHTFTPTFKTVLNITGRPPGALDGAYNNLYAVVSLNNSNPGFVGDLVLGNDTVIDTQGGRHSNPDANHILRLNHDQALNGSNQITLLNDVTLQVPGHNVTIGSLIDDLNNASKDQTKFSFGENGNITTGTTGNIISGSQAIVENGSATPSILTINQTQASAWSFLIRDGYTVDGARTASLGLVKTGPATVQILNVNDFSGGLTVLDGAVMVRNSGNSGSATGSGKVDVIGGTFGGDNTSPVAGDLTIRDNGVRPGVLAPNKITDTGVQIGASLFLTKLTFEGFSQFDIDTYSSEDGGDNSRVFLKSSLDINGTVTLNLRMHFNNGIVGHFFTVGDPIDLDGEFIKLFVSDTQIAFGPNGHFVYNNQFVGDGSDLVGFYLDENGDPTTEEYVMRLSINDTEVRLTAVPEPNVALSLIAGAGALVGLQRFRRRSARA
jgi:autotransporter-associated beta strand protein